MPVPKGLVQTVKFGAWNSFLPEKLLQLFDALFSDANIVIVTDVEAGDKAVPCFDWLVEAQH